jgi:hypothetical protein
MRQLVTVNGPTGLELVSQWCEDEEAADRLQDELHQQFLSQRVCISCHSEQELEDGPTA